MNEYEINDETLAIMPDNVWNSIVVEDQASYEISKKTLDIVDYSCKYFGSSYDGRKSGAKTILNSGYKLPILVEGTRNIVFFPTISPLDADCCWISLKNIKSYSKINDYQTLVEFKNNRTLVVNISLNSFNNQVMRASRLESTIRNRQTKKETI